MNKNFLTRIISFVLAAMMILTSLPINTFAETGEPNTGNTEKKTMNYDKTPIGKEQINGDLEVKVAKPADGKTAKELSKILICRSCTLYVRIIKFNVEITR